MKILYTPSCRKLRLIASALILTATASAWAQADAKADPCEGKTYRWIDENGAVRTAPYLETATDPNQMKALVASLFMDRTIPGQKRFGYYYTDSYRDGAGYTHSDINLWYSSPDGHARTAAGTNGNYWVDMTYYIYKDVTGKYNTGEEWRPTNLLYAQYGNFAPMLQQLAFKKVSHPDSKSHTAWQADITPDEDGKTALLIEMTDDYQATQDLDAETAWSHIKSITVLPLSRQYRVDNKTDDKKSGYLFNINRPLNKFFVAIKGDIMDRGTSSNFAPLYEGYEQLAPSVEDEDYEFGKFVENAYPQMLDGSVFPVSHNCASVPARAHATMMGAKSSDEAIQANMLVWLPDYRYVGQELYEINSYTQTSGVDYRPYFFIYTIPLTSGIDNINAVTHNVQVKNSWTSKLKSVTKDDEPERFRLLRSYDRTNWTEVPAAEIEKVITAGATKNEATGYLTHNESTVEVLVHEKQYAEPDTVYYKVFGRLANTEFDEVVSNETMVPIPGYASGTTPKLSIALQHTSTFDKKGQKNNYVNTVSFLLQGKARQNDGLKHSNIGDNTVFYLKRYDVTGTLDKNADNFNVNDGTLVAKVKFTYKSNNSITGIYQYNVTITDMTGEQPVDGETYVLYSWSGKGVALTSSREFHFQNEYTEDTPWGTFVDKFSYDLTKDGHADETTYYYRLFAEDALNVDNAVNPGEIRSNVAKAIMPPMTHDAGFTSYSLDEIKGDQDAHLEPSTPQTTLIPLSASASVKKCVIELADEDVTVAEADRTGQGIWVMKGYGTDGGVIDENTLQPGATGGVSVSADPRYMGNTTVMVIHDGENTYGTARVTIPVLPVVKVHGIKLDWDNYKRNGYNTSAKLSVSLPESVDEHFRSHGYGVWSLEGIVLPPLMREIADMSHHKHNTDEEACSFWYLKDVPANTSFVASSSSAAPGDIYEEGTICGDKASASISEFRETNFRGTSNDPYARWYKARYYARYISPAELENPSGASHAPAEHRYIVVENREGAREEGTGHTTGVSSADILPDAVYPRVTDDIVNIDGAGTVIVCNLQGMTVATLDDNGGDTATRTVSLGHLPAGLYIVSLNGNTYKIIKN
ncbi:MAG: hypothetical protein ACI30N_01685 [Muribaculaceae bacterium]